MKNIAFILAYRQFLKNKRYTFIKVGSLAVGFLFFILIVLYYQHEHSYEKWNPNYKKVVRLELRTLDSTNELIPLSSYPIGSYLQSFSGTGILKVTRVNGFTSYSELTIARSKNEETFYIKDVINTDSLFFDVFPYPFIYGSAAHALKQPNAIVLSKTTSEQLFGKTNPLGKTVWYNNSTLLTVTGVIDAEKYPSHLKHDAIVNLVKENPLWEHHYFYTYFLIDASVSPHHLSQSLTNLTRLSYSVKRNNVLLEGSAAQIHLQPIANIHLKGKSHYETRGNTDNAILTIFLIVGIAIMVITAINFFNLSVMQLVSRNKEIHTDLLFSANVRTIYRRFSIETLGYVLMGLFFTFILLELSYPMFEEYFGVRLSLFAQNEPLRIILVVIGTILALVVLGGVLPIYQLLKIPTAQILKGNYLFNQVGRRFLNLMLSFQLSLTFMAFVAFTVIFNQFTFLVSQNLNYDLKDVLAIRVHKTINRTNYLQLKAALLKHPAIEFVSYNFVSPGNSGLSTPFIYYKDTLLYGLTNIVTPDYEKVFKIKVKDGRTFSDSLLSDSGAIILTQNALAFNRKLNIDVRLNTHPVLKDAVIGSVEDYYHQSVGQEMLPIIWLNCTSALGGGDLLVRLTKANQYPDYLKHIEQIMKQYEPNYPLSHKFLRDYYMEQYFDIIQLVVIFLFILMISCIIVLVGLFATSAFIARQRQREIAIRTVLGANTFQIISGLNRRFFTLIFVSALLSSPIVYLALRYWLNRFSEHVTITIWPFLISFAVIAIAALAINAIVGIKALHRKPINTLRNE